MKTKFDFHAGALSFAKSFASFAGLLALLVMLAAAAPAARAGAAGGAITVRFRTLAWEGNIDGIHYETGGRATPVTIYSFVRSPYFAYSGTPQIAFFRVQPGLDGKEVRLPAGTASLENAGPQPLLVFIPDPARPNAFQIMVMDDSAASFPAGAFKFCNLTAATLHVALNDSPPVALPPRAQTVVRVSPADGTDAVNLRIFKRTADGEEDIFSEAWRHLPDLRRLIFIAGVPDGSGGARTAVKWLDEGASTLAPPANSPRRGN